MNDEKQKSTNSMLNRLIEFCLLNKLVVLLIVMGLVAGGLYVMPFQRGMDWFPAAPIPVDAIPDIGENQQIVFADWPGRSPQDVEDQVGYPLSVMLQGVPGVKSVRSFSMFGFATIYVIFRSDVDFYWARSRLLERLSVAQQRLPAGVIPVLGPDATALGQIFWYTLEGQGFDLQELRSVQDWYVRYALQSVEGVAEVASIGGHVKEYQIDVDPAALRAANVPLQSLFEAVRGANIDVGAQTIEHNGVEYIVRGKGFIRSVADVEDILLKTVDGVPIFVRNVAKVQLGPALRRGTLDKEGAEAVGGVVVCRHGENPLAVIAKVKEKLKEIQSGLPRKTLPDGVVSQVEIVPFYDRSGLIQETLGTLKDALVEEILATCFVVFMLLSHFRSNLLICSSVPLTIMATFILMALFRVDSNLMSLAGIAIAIGAMVDMGIVLSENIVRHFALAAPDEDPLEVIKRAACEVAGAVTSAVTVTIVSFLPVFALSGPEGLLFKPLACTKTFALFASIFVALTVLPAFAHILFKRRRLGLLIRLLARLCVPTAGVAAAALWNPWVGIPLIIGGLVLLAEPFIPQSRRNWAAPAAAWMGALLVLVLLAMHWMPLGLDVSLTRNIIFVLGVNLAWISVRLVIVNGYTSLLGLFLRFKAAFLSVPSAMIVLGLVIWLGFEAVFGWIPADVSAIGYSGAELRTSKTWSALSHAFPGMGREFMPSFDEGAFLFMPSTMPHAGLEEVMDIVRKQDMAIRAIPEVELVVGKIGRAETALDPAPTSMIETLVTYKPEFGPPDPVTGARPRLWREHVRTSDDIWREIVKAAAIPGCTSAAKLQPIAARIVMLQSGMRAPMGLKIYGQSLDEIEALGRRLAMMLKEVPGVDKDSIIPDQVVGKPYIEIDIDRVRAARYGVGVRAIQDVVETAIGGVPATTTVEGRARYPVRVRYARELRDSPEELGRILVPSDGGAQVPLSQLAEIRHSKGLQEIKSEDSFLVSYVLFDKLPSFAEVDVAEAVQRAVEAGRESGKLEFPPGTHVKIAGEYENHVNFMKRFSVVLPGCLLLILLILQLHFRNTPVTLLIFAQIAVAWAAGFIALWLAAQPWFLNLEVFGQNIRTLFHLREYNLSVAVWVGFLALFGLACDDAVIIATYLEQQFKTRTGLSVSEVRGMVVEGARRRIRPCLMTTATTVLALLPVLASDGKGADVMIPMALPIFGGMTLELITVFITPVLYCWLKERKAV